MGKTDKQKQQMEWTIEKIGEYYEQCFNEDIFNGEGTKLEEFYHNVKRKFSKLSGMEINYDKGSEALNFVNEFKERLKGSEVLSQDFPELRLDELLTNNNFFSIELIPSLENKRNRNKFDNNLDYETKDLKNHFESSVNKDDSFYFAIDKSSGKLSDYKKLIEENQSMISLKQYNDSIDTACKTILAEEKRFNSNLSKVEISSPDFKQTMDSLGTYLEQSEYFFDLQDKESNKELKATRKKKVIQYVNERVGELVDILDILKDKEKLQEGDYKIAKNTAQVIKKEYDDANLMFKVDFLKNAYVEKIEENYSELLKIKGD